MSASSTTNDVGVLHPDRLRATEPLRHVMLARLVAGVPLFGIGLSHVLFPEAAMRPLVEAAGFPLPAIVSPVGVAMQIVAGILLLSGWWARLGGVLTIPTMLGAVYAHLAIDVWPNAPQTSEPPLALPIAVLAGGLYVLWRGAGRWSLDRRHRSRAA